MPRKNVSKQIEKILDKADKNNFNNVAEEKISNILAVEKKQFVDSGKLLYINESGTIATSTIKVDKIEFIKNLISPIKTQLKDLTLYDISTYIKGKTISEKYYNFKNINKIYKELSTELKHNRRTNEISDGNQNKFIVNGVYDGDIFIEGKLRNSESIFVHNTYTSLDTNTYEAHIMRLTRKPPFPNDTTDMIVWYKFRNDINDSSENNNDLQAYLKTDAPADTGDIPKYLIKDGYGDYIVFNNDYAVVVPRPLNDPMYYFQPNMTISFWLYKPTLTSYETIVMNRESHYMGILSENLYGGWSIFTENKNILVRITTEDNKNNVPYHWIGSNVIQEATWQYVTIVFEHVTDDPNVKNNIHLYIDGQHFNTLSFNSEYVQFQSDSIDTAPLALGTVFYGFNGNTAPGGTYTFSSSQNTGIYDFRMYDRILTEEEINKLYIYVPPKEIEIIQYPKISFTSKSSSNISNYGSNRAFDGQTTGIFIWISSSPVYTDGQYSPTGTYYLDPDYRGEYIIIDLGEETIINQMKMYGRNGADAQRHPRNYRIYGSNDQNDYNNPQNGNWEQIFEKINDTPDTVPSSYPTVDEFFDNFTTYRYYALVTNKVYSGNQYVELLEWELFHVKIPGNDPPSLPLVLKYPPAPLPTNNHYHLSTERFSTTTLEGQEYGNGEYIVSWSTHSTDHYRSTTPGVFSDEPATDGYAHAWQAYQYYQTQYKTELGNGLSDVLGDWLRLKLPIKLKLSYIEFYITENEKYKQPAYTVFGTNDNGVTWKNILEVSILDIYGADGTGGTYPVTLDEPGLYADTDLTRYRKHISPIINDTELFNEYGIVFTETLWTTTRIAFNDIAFYGTEDTGGEENQVIDALLRINQGNVKNIIDASVGPTDVFSVSHIGNLGIKTKYPTEKLDVRGSINVSGNINDITSTEIGYMSNTTDNVQYQLDLINKTIEENNESMNSHVINTDLETSNYIIQDMIDKTIYNKNSVKENIENLIDNVANVKQDNFTTHNGIYFNSNNNFIELVQESEWDTNTVDDYINYGSVQLHRDSIKINNKNVLFSDNISGKQDIISDAIINSTLYQDLAPSKMLHISQDFKHPLINGLNTQIKKIQDENEFYTIFTDTSTITFDKEIYVDMLLIGGGNTSDSGGVIYNKGSVFSPGKYFINVGKGNNGLEQTSTLITTITTSYDDETTSPVATDVAGNTDYQYYVFEKSGSITFNNDVECEILVVGGGGAGGASIGGGGGGGAVVHIPSVNLNGSYDISVGAGGTWGSDGSGIKEGGSSSFGTQVVAGGGGKGGSFLDNATATSGTGGSSGGMGAATYSGDNKAINEAGSTFGTYTGGVIYRNEGGKHLNERTNTEASGVGGGGAGSSGANINENIEVGNGGDGILINIRGDNQKWGAGGGGGTYSNATVGVGGEGGGGNGSYDTFGGSIGTAGVANTGSGGGGSGYIGGSGENGGIGGNGGSGVVIIRVPATTGGDISTSSSIYFKNKPFAKTFGSDNTDGNLLPDGGISEINDISIANILSQPIAAITNNQDDSTYNYGAIGNNGIVILKWFQGTPIPEYSYYDRLLKYPYYIWNNDSNTNYDSYLDTTITIKESSYNHNYGAFNLFKGSGIENESRPNDLSKRIYHSASNTYNSSDGFGINEYRTNYKGEFVLIDLGKEIYLDNYKMQHREVLSTIGSTALPVSWRIYASNNNDVFQEINVTLNGNDVNTKTVANHESWVLLDEKENSADLWIESEQYNQFDYIKGFQYRKNLNVKLDSKQILSYRYFMIIFNKIEANKNKNFILDTLNLFGNTEYKILSNSDAFVDNTDDLLVWYKFDNNLSDSSVNKIDLIPWVTSFTNRYAIPQYNNSIVEKGTHSIYLDGLIRLQANNLDNNPNFYTPEQMTLSVWFKGGSLQPYKQTLASAKGGVHKGWAIYFIGDPSDGSANIIRFDYGNENYTDNYGIFDFSAKTKADTWYHLVFVFDRNRKSETDITKIPIDLYVDGVKNSTIEIKDDFGTSQKDFGATNLLISSTNNWKTTDFRLKQFYIDDFRLYNRVLTHNEILELFNYNHDSIITKINGVEVITQFSFGDDPTDMVAWYKFEDDFRDSSYNGHDLTPNVGVPKFTDNSKYGTKSVWFEGNTQWNSTPNKAGLFLDNLSNRLSTHIDNSITISFWVYTLGKGQINYGHIFSGIASNNYRFDSEFTILYKNNTEILGFMSNDNYENIIDVTSDGGEPFLNRWVHIVWILDGTNTSIYIDGEKKVDKTDYIFPTITDTYTFTIGAWNVNNPDVGGARDINGYLDDFRIYKRALTPGEIDILYNYVPNLVTETTQTTQTTNEPAFGDSTTDMLAWYKFDGDFTDSSGNSKDLTEGNVSTTFDSDSVIGTHSISFPDIAGQELTSTVDLSGNKSFSISFWIFRDKISESNYIISTVIPDVAGGR
jgi:hypothetical protein